MQKRLNDIVQSSKEARDEPGSLPFRVSVMLLLQRELMKSKLDLARIDALINQDPSLAATLLAHTNRLLPHEVSSVAHALALMDSSQLEVLFVNSGAGSYTSKLARGFAAAEWCDYSVQTARVARSLAIDIGFPGALAYTAGLLHATGELVMHLFPRTEVRELDEAVSPFNLYRRHYEVEKLGYSYARFSTSLASTWQLPHLLIKAIQDHEDPFARKNYHPLTSILHLAVWRVRVMWDKQADVSDASLHATYPAEVALAIGLDMDMVLQRDSLNWSDAWQEPPPILNELA